MVLFLTALRGTFLEYEVSRNSIGPTVFSCIYPRGPGEKRRMINAAVALRLTDSPIERRVLKSVRNQQQTRRKHLHQEERKENDNIVLLLATSDRCRYDKIHPFEDARLCCVIEHKAGRRSTLMSVHGGVVTSQWSRVIPYASIRDGYASAARPEGESGLANARS